MFDLDGTLRYTRPSANETIFEIAAQLGASDSPIDRHRTARWVHRYWAQSETLAADLKTFGHDDNLFWTNYVRRELQVLGCSPEEAADLAPKLQERMLAEYQPESWIPPDVTTTLPELSKAGFVVGLVTNRRRPVQDELAELGLLPYFDFVVFAGEVNVWKPSPEIFQHAMERAASTPEQTVFVGDNFYSDIMGAQNAGLHPVLIDPQGIFPEAECPVIHSVGDLLEMLL